MRRFVALCLVLAACGGGTVSDGGPRPGFGPGTTEADAVELPPVLDTAAQIDLVLTDDDLPPDLRHLVTGRAESTGSSEPPFFPTGSWVIGTAETYRPETLATEVVEIPGLRDSGLTIASGTMAFGSEAEASTVFDIGLSAARTDGARITRLDDLGDEAALIRSGSDRPVRQVIVRRGAVLVSVASSAAFGDGLPSDDAVTTLAATLDARTAAALADELDPLDPHVFLLSSPALQLSSYEFRLDSTYAFQAGDQTITMTGRFEAPNQQECTVSVDGRAVVTVVGDGMGLATEQNDGWRYLDEQDARQIDAGCLGSNAYFDAALEMFDEASYIGFDESFEFDLQTVNGVETRHYGIDDVSFRGLFDEIGRLDQFDIWFDAADGWPVRLRIVGLFSSETVRGPGVLGTQDVVPTTITLDIVRPDDPTVTVEVPDDIRSSATGV